MSLIVPLLSVTAFAAFWLRRLKIDIEQEKSFRAQLSGLSLNENLVR